MKYAVCRCAEKDASVDEDSPKGGSTEDVTRRKDEPDWEKYKYSIKTATDLPHLLLSPLHLTQTNHSCQFPLPLMDYPIRFKHTLAFILNAPYAPITFHNPFIPATGPTEVLSSSSSCIVVEYCGLKCVLGLVFFFLLYLYI